MKKLIGIAAVALLAAGCSGSDNGSSSSSTSTTTGTTSHTTTTGGNTTTGTNGSSSNTTGTTTGTAANTTGTNGSSNTTGTNGTGGTSGDSVTGPLGFTVGKTLEIQYVLGDGGLDPTAAEIDMTDDSTDTCEDIVGYPDGGFPAAETYYLSLLAVDPSGIADGTAYHSPSVAQWNTYIADGGGVTPPLMEAQYYDPGGDFYVGVNGTATFGTDATTQARTVTFSLTLGKFNSTTNTISATGTQAIAGNGTAACVVQTQ